MKCVLPEEWEYHINKITFRLSVCLCVSNCHMHCLSTISQQNFSRTLRRNLIRNRFSNHNLMHLPSFSVNFFNPFSIKFDVFLNCTFQIRFCMVTQNGDDSFSWSIILPQSPPHPKPRRNHTP